MDLQASAYFERNVEPRIIGNSVFISVGIVDKDIIEHKISCYWKSYRTACAVNIVAGEAETARQKVV